MACVIHLAGTGDHSFERRLRLGGPLLKDNIATMVLERCCTCCNGWILASYTNCHTTVSCSAFCCGTFL